MSELTEPKSEKKVALGIAKAVAAIGISILTLWWAGRSFDLGQASAKLKETSAGVVALYFASLVVIHVSRVVRYWLLVAPLGPITPRAVFSAVSVGIPAAFFLPFRLGELVRPAMVSRAGVPIAGALASVVVERVFDGVWTVGTFFVVLQMLPASTQVSPLVRTGAQAALIAFGGGLVFLVLAYLARGPVLGLVERLLSKVSPGIAHKVVSLISTFLDGLAALGTLPRFLAFVALTAFYWGLNAWGTLLLARSYGLDVPFLAGPFTISALVFAVMVPAGPAFVGTYELGFQLGMIPFGASEADALLVAAVSHFFQLVMLALIAGLGVQVAEPTQKDERTAREKDG